MPNILPLKLVDTGAGNGQLKEFDVGDIIAAAYLPPSTPTQSSQYDLTAGRVLLTQAYGFPVNAQVFSGNIDNRFLVPLGTVICDTSTLGTKPTTYGFLTSTSHIDGSGFHQEWVEINPSISAPMKRYWRDGYASLGNTAWQQYASTASSSTVGPWNPLSPYFASGTVGYLATPYFRLNGDRVEFRGGLGKSGGFGGAGNVLATLPAGYRPAYAPSGMSIAQCTAAPSGALVLGNLVVDSSGLLQYSVAGGGSNGSGVSLESLSYTVGA